MLIWKVLFIILGLAIMVGSVIFGIGLIAGSPFLLAAGAPFWQFLLVGFVDLVVFFIGLLFFRTAFAGT